MRWVIGGTSGIGAAIAEIFGNYDKKSPIVDDAYLCDVRRYDQMSSALHDAVVASAEEEDEIKTIVYSAGINDLAFLGTMGKDGMKHAEDVVDVNMMGFIRLMDLIMDKEVFPEEWRRGLTVLAITSDAGERPMRTSMAYCASKAGLNMAVKVAARECAAHGIRVLGIAPGMTEGTKMTQYIDSTVPGLRAWTEEQAIGYEQMQEVTPGRLIPEELAVVAIMAANGPIHWTGDIITVNGGR